MMIALVIILISYGIGTISPAYILVRLWTGNDIREYGSGNAGTTNVMRILGAKAAVFVLLMDLLKGVIAVYLGRYMGGEALAATAGLSAVIGHNWPVTMKLKGGKGVATSIGVGLMINPFYVWICIALSIFIITFSKYVSLASITAIPLWTVLLAITGSPIEHVILGIALSSLVIYRHYANILRIYKGTENRFSLKTKLSKEERSK
ncbi:glycerol-3-phosphate 1-O-acyltransferase PlsY [Tindallia californiensis]|uniref:Glycerol-3-phosphate acyltransferase n=1 Tax=Tindallia californiensis TaxID=159292 RepID=A0A1H3JPY9_9FIRM|nr:glycerol-3-phosphate 1-O-acyltransferase PlsY [Tindallia californiensis]SDY41605.1 glycerol-3-phosphate acyltransferase PlsY [Tindallia californiensis]